MAGEKDGMKVGACALSEVEPERECEIKSLSSVFEVGSSSFASSPSSPVDFVSCGSSDQDWKG